MLGRLTGGPGVVVVAGGGSAVRVDAERGAPVGYSNVDTIFCHGCRIGAVSRILEIAGVADFGSTAEMAVTAGCGSCATLDERRAYKRGAAGR